MIGATATFAVFTLCTAIAGTLFRAMPDSIEFLVMRRAANREIRDLLVRLNPAVNIPSDCQFVVNGEKTRGVPVWQLFSAGRACGTLFLWASYFRHVYDFGDQRSLDTKPAAKSRNRGRAILASRHSVRLRQRVRNAACRVSGESLRCSTRSAGRSAAGYSISVSSWAWADHSPVGAWFYTTFRNCSAIARKLLKNGLKCLETAQKFFFDKFPRGVPPVFPRPPVGQKRHHPQDLPVSGGSY